MKQGSHRQHILMCINIQTLRQPTGNAELTVHCQYAVLTSRQIVHTQVTWYENMTSAVKPEIHNLSQCRQRRTEPRPRASCTKKYLVKFVFAVSSYASGQTDRQTDVLITAWAKLNSRRAENHSHRDVQTSDTRAISGSNVSTGPARPWVYIVIVEAYRRLNCCGMNS